MSPQKEVSDIRKKQRWRATARAEKSKLSNKEEGWQLRGGTVNGAAVTSRTRHGGNGRPNFTCRGRLLESVNGFRAYASESSEDSSWSGNSQSSSSESEDDEGLEEEKTKPPPSRVIMEVKSLKSTLEKTSRCLECYGSVDVSLQTLCLATSVMMSCKNPKCAFVYYSDPPAQVTLERLDNRARSTDFAINSLYVLSFLSCGDGCTEAARVLGLLGLPNDTTMESRSFGIIEGRISGKIQSLYNNLLEENLIEEVRLSMEVSPVHDANDFILWQQSLKTDNVPFSQSRYPSISCSFDMGWQQRGSGGQYNSMSGHALLAGALTRKPVCFVLKSKLCNFCCTWKKRNPDFDIEFMPDHDCTKNHEGLSSSMEPSACLDMVMELYNKYHCDVAKMVADDDSSTRAMLRWSNADYMLNNKRKEQRQATAKKG
jgi:hypothetical protein